MTTALTSVPELAPAGPDRSQRGVRFPQLILSLLVVAVFALLAVWWQASTTARRPVLALANDVTVGVPITRLDLTEVYVNTDVPMASESPEFADFFVGVSPIADFEAGTLITDAMFRTTAALGPNEAMVGIKVTSNQAPSGLVVGDRVQVLVADSSGEVRVVAPDAIVEAVSVGGNDGDRALRLRMGITQAQQTQVLADDVVLIEVEESDVSSWNRDGAEPGTAEPVNAEISDDQ